MSCATSGSPTRRARSPSSSPRVEPGTTMTIAPGSSPEPERVAPIARRRRSRLGIGDGGGRALVVAAASTVVFFSVLALVVVNAPGWAQVQDKFLNGKVFA